MTYETFKTAVLKELESHFPTDTSITFHKIPRNNSISAEGLTILEPGFNIAPTIYLKDYYESFRHGASMNGILEELLDSYYRYRPSESIDPSFFSSFQNIKGRVAYKLVHTERNQELLQEIPNVPFLDLSIVFYCLVTTGKHGNATILIRNSHLDLWHTDTSQLMRLAQTNTPFLLSSQCSELTSLLDPYLPAEGGTDLKECLEGSVPMYVLTNESRLYGAACILYEDLLSDLSTRWKSDLYILPSSIHEVILIPAWEQLSRKYFNSMIQEVNDTQVTREEILSDHAYFYSQSQKMMRIL